MRNILYITAGILILLSFSCTKDISSGQADTFIKFYGNQYMDEARDLKIMDDGSFAICGIDSVTGEGKRAVLIVTDQFGNMKKGFPKYYADGSNPSAANALVLKKGGENGFLLVGYTEVPVSDVQSPAATGSQKDLFLVRTDKNGGELWTESFGSEEDETALDAAEMISSGGFMLAGYQIKNGKKDIMIMGVNDQGDSIELGFNYFGTSIDNAAANFILNTGEQYLAVCTYDKVGSDGTDILVLDFDDELSAIASPLGDNLDESAESIIRTGGNQFLVLGNRTNVSGRSEIILYLIEIDGILITKTSPLTPVSEVNADLVASRIIQTADGGYAIVGTRIIGDDRDIFLQFMDENFQAKERIIYGSGGAQSGTDIGLPESGGMLMLGTNGLPQAGNSMISLIRAGEAGEL